MAAQIHAAVEKEWSVIYVALSVICSVLVSVLLKMSRRFDIDIGVKFRDYLTQRVWRLGAAREAMKQLYQSMRP